MDFRSQMPCLSWELLFSMLYMLCTDKQSSLNLNLMISSNYVVIKIMLMVLCIHVYVCIYVCCCLVEFLGIMIVLC